MKFPRCGRRERPPYGPGQHGGLPGNRRPCAVTNPCRGGFHIRPVRGGARFRGRAMALPYNHGERPAKREGHTPPGGRRAGCPHPAAPRGGGNVPGFEFRRCGGRERPPYGPGQHGGPPGIHRPCVATNPCRGRFHIRPVRGGQGPAGGINPSPTTHGRPAANRGKTRPRVITNPCRGRCLHCARRRVSEANRATGPALRPEIVPRGLWRCKVPREGHGPPLQIMANARPNGKGTRPPAAVGRDALIPPHPAAAGTPAGGINPSPTNHEGPTLR